MLLSGALLDRFTDESSSLLDLHRYAGLLWHCSDHGYMAWTSGRHHVFGNLVGLCFADYAARLVTASGDNFYLVDAAPVVMAIATATETVSTFHPSDRGALLEPVKLEYASKARVYSQSRWF